MEKIVIGLVGETGSGKDTVANYLNNEFDAKLMRFADPIKDTLSIYFSKLSKQDQQWLYLAFKERFGEDILCRAMEKRLEKEDADLIVVNGLRMPCDFDFIKAHKGKVLYVTADSETRWKRVSSRGEKTDDNISFKKFQQLDRGETEVHIPEIGKRADKIIENDSTLEKLLAKVNGFMEEIGVKFQSNRKGKRIESGGPMAKAAEENKEAEPLA